MSAIPPVTSSTFVNGSNSSSGSLLNSRIVKVALAVFVSIAAFALLPPPLAFVISAISIYLAFRSSSNETPNPNDNYYAPSQNLSTVNVVYRERAPQPVVILRHPPTTYFYDLPPEDTSVFRRRHVSSQAPSHRPEGNVLPEDQRTASYVPPLSASHAEHSAVGDRNSRSASTQPPVFIDTSNRVNETPSAPIVHTPLALEQPQRHVLSEDQRTAGYNTNPPSQAAGQPSSHAAVGGRSTGSHSENSFAAVRNAASAIYRMASSIPSPQNPLPPNSTPRHAGVGTRGPKG